MVRRRLWKAQRYHVRGRPNAGAADAGGSSLREVATVRGHHGRREG
jgi:hypothetical protein